LGGVKRKSYLGSWTTATGASAEENVEGEFCWNNQPKKPCKGLRCFKERKMIEKRGKTWNPGHVPKIWGRVLGKVIAYNQRKKRHEM